MNEQITNDIKYLDKVCDNLAQACYDMAQTDDWVAHAALVTLEGMLDDLCERVTELRNIKRVVEEVRRNDG